MGDVTKKKNILNRNGEAMEDNNKSIQLEENKLYLIRNKKLIVVDPPESGHGESSVTWRDGKAVRLDTRSTKQL